MHQYVSWFPDRPSDGHKGTFGTCLIAAGSERYWGAPLLSARAALRSGVGICALAVPPSLKTAVACSLPEVTMPPCAVDERGVLSADSAVQLCAALESMRVKAMLVGPGMHDAKAFLGAMLRALETRGDRCPPLVIDADALNALAEFGDEWHTLLGLAATRCVLTPHPGEMSRLCGNKPIGEFSSDAQRLQLAQAFAKARGVVVLLKGARTVIASATQHVVLPFANAALSVGGSGDVLAGVIVALLAQGLPPFKAAVVGGYWHGVAGERLAAQYGASGGLAHELADLIPAARLHMLEHLAEH